MSSDDDFASYDPTTPVVKKPSNNATRSKPVNTRNNAEPLAGPSKAAKPRQVSKKTAIPKRPIPIDDEEEEEQEQQAEEEDVIMVSDGESKKRKAPAGGRRQVAKKVALSRNTNTSKTRKGAAAAEKEVLMVNSTNDEEEEEPEQPLAQKAKSKGKGRANTNGAGKAKEKERDIGEDVEMDGDEVEVVEDRPKRGGARNAQAGKSSAAPTKGVKKGKDSSSSLEVEVERLRKSLEEVTAQRDRLTEELEESLQIRITEPEAALEKLKEAYEARLTTQSEMIETQAKLVASLGSGNSGQVPYFLSREKVEEEKKDLRNEIARWKETVNERNAIIKEKDKQYAELQTQLEVTEKDLKAEIERGKSLVAKNPPPSVTRNRIANLPKDQEDPRHKAITKLYEDLCNCLILSVKWEKSQYPNMEDIIFDCLFTSPPNPDAQPGVPKPELHFSLRKMYDKNPDGDSKDPPTEKIQYQPLDLDKVPPEYTEQLDFFKEPFVFAYDQLFIFWKTLMTKFGVSDDDDEDDDEEEEDREGGEEDDIADENRIQEDFL
ncbi:hypothetical protein C8Q75DRAFT_728846 [Abortiporus biennis]|nr:hypothetical protein C8Q75DRAFT_728846 [Abortiporus biennis]